MSEILPPVTPEPVTPELDATKLRELAEFADGHRDVELVITSRPASAGGFEVEIGEPQSGSSTIPGAPAPTPLFRVYTRSTVGRRIAPQVTIQIASSTSRLEIPKDTDALFWTESAVEKFLWPYYGSMRIYENEIATLKKLYYDPNTGPLVVAIAHVPPSHSTAVSASTGAFHIAFSNSTGDLQFATVAEFAAWFS